MAKKSVHTGIIVSILALFVATTTSFVTYKYKTSFDNIVKESHETTDGYDQQFIDLVNKLEDELASRAQFGYQGGEDPMTGQKRTVVVYKKPKKRSRTAPKKVLDDFRLAAIIYDNKDKKYTAIMMRGERSLAVEENENILGRKVLQITKDKVIMIDKKYRYYYDIYGKKDKNTI